MRISEGSQVKNINLPSLNGEEFNLESLQGKKFLITFF